MKFLDIVRVPLGLLAGVMGIALSVPAVLALLPFWLVDGLTRGLRRLFEPPTVAWEDVIEFAPEVGWKPRPNLDAHVVDFNGDAYHVTTDSHGWRGKGTVEDADAVVFGDSYAFGCGVDDSDFFSNLSPDLRIKAIGSPAYSMVHSLMWMERVASELGGKLVVWFVYHGNDLVDNLHPALLRYRSPFVRRNDAGDWEIRSGHVDPSRWTVDSREGEMEGFIEICSPGHQSARAFEACDFLIRRAAEICAEAGARLVVMTIPDLSPVADLALAKAQEARGQGADFDRGLPDRKIGESCRSAGVSFLALGQHLTAEDYLEHDFHWSPRGNQRVADLIRQQHEGPGAAPQKLERAINDTAAIERRTG
jgi:hypothetical protein